MAHEIALSMVNDLKMQLSRLARSTADAMKDGKVTPLEGIMLANNGMQIGISLIAMMQNRELAIKEDILYILEHGVLTVNDTTTFMVQPAKETEEQIKQEQEAAKTGELRGSNIQQSNQPVQQSPADISQLHKSGMATTTDHEHIHEQQQAVSVGQHTSQSHGQQQVDPSHSQEQTTQQQKDELKREQEQHNADMNKDQPHQQPRRSRP